jgi:hypothetical protein
VPITRTSDKTLDADGTFEIKKDPFLSARDELLNPSTHDSIEKDSTYTELLILVKNCMPSVRTKVERIP